MKAKNILIVSAILAMSMIFSACGTITGPEPPPPPPPDNSKYYDLQVEYIRPEILNPAAENFIPSVHLVSPAGDPGGHPYQFFTMIDNLHFRCEFPHVKGGLSGYYFHQLDQAMYDGSDPSSMMVGGKYIVTVKSIGAPTELKDIRPYNLSTNPYPGPKARAAFFDLSTEGVISSNPR